MRMYKEQILRLRLLALTAALGLQITYSSGSVNRIQQKVTTARSSHTAGSRGVSRFNPPKRRITVSCFGLRIATRTIFRLYALVIMYTGMNMFYANCLLLRATRSMVYATPGRFIYLMCAK